MAKITIEDLLARKGVIEKKKVLYSSKELKGEIELVQATLKETSEILARHPNAATDPSEGLAMSCKLILKHCPAFRNESLQEGYGVAEPHEIVTVLLNESMDEISEIVEIILDFYGLGDDDKQEEIENEVKN